jgi:hypothetical protein
MKPRAFGPQLLKATGIAVVGWITPRIYDLITLQEGAIHLQAFSTGSAVELLWVVLMCGLGLGLYRFLGQLSHSFWISLLMLVILPTGVIYVHHITIGNRYAIIQLDEKTISLSGRPFSGPLTILVSDVSQVHLVNRNDGEEMELEFFVGSGKVSKTCHVYGMDRIIVSRLQMLIQKMRELGIRVTETRITVAPT